MLGIFHSALVNLVNCPPTCTNTLGPVQIVQLYSLYSPVLRVFGALESHIICWPRESIAMLLGNEDIVTYCFENVMSCIGQLANGPKELHPSDRPGLGAVKMWTGRCKILMRSPEV